MQEYPACKGEDLPRGCISACHPSCQLFRAHLQTCNPRRGKGVLEGACESVEEHAFAGGFRQVGCQVAQQNRCVGPDGGLFINLQAVGAKPLILSTKQAAGTGAPVSRQTVQQRSELWMQ